MNDVIKTSLVAVTLAFTGCSASGGIVAAPVENPSVPLPPPVVASPSPTLDRSKTITIDGKQYTCGETIDAKDKVCGDNYQIAFNQWGDGIDAYVNSGTLGPLGNDKSANAVMRYEDVAASGLAACIIGTRGTGFADTQRQNEFIDFLLRSYPDQPRVNFLPFWFQASKTLCPDAFADRISGTPHPPIGR